MKRIYMSYTFVYIYICIFSVQNASLRLAVCMYGCLCVCCVSHCCWLYASHTARIFKFSRHSALHIVRFAQRRRQLARSLCARALDNKMRAAKCESLRCANADDLREYMNVTLVERCSEWNFSRIRTRTRIILSLSLPMSTIRFVASDARCTRRVHTSLCQRCGEYEQ